MDDEKTLKDLDDLNDSLTSAYQRFEILRVTGELSVQEQALVEKAQHIAGNAHQIVKGVRWMYCNRKGKPKPEAREATA